MGLQGKFNGLISRLRIGRNVAVGVSGGADSMALVHLLSRYNNVNGSPLDITLITIDHRYRKESGEECLKIAQMMHDIGVRHVTIPIQWQVPVTAITNFEEKARIERYRLISKYCHLNQVENLMLGHNFDDQIETFLMRLSQHSTLFGLKCMSLVTRNDPRLVRPLLDVEKDSIYDFCKNEEIQWFEDKTNQIPSLTRRNSIRHSIRNKKINKYEVQLLLKQVQDFVKLLETKMALLYEQLIKQEQLIIDDHYCTIKLTVPLSILDRDLVLLNRFIWCLSERLSPILKFHYTYNATLFDRINSIRYRDMLKFNKLGCDYEITKENNNIQIKISRELPREPVVERIANEKFEFDNRFKISTELRDVDIKILDKHDFKLLNRFKEENSVDFKNTEVLKLPCLLKGLDIIAMPTLDLWDMKHKKAFEVSFKEITFE